MLVVGSPLPCELKPLVELVPIGKNDVAAAPVVAAGVPPPTNAVDPTSDLSEVASSGVKVLNVADMDWKDCDADAELLAFTLMVVIIVVRLDVTTEASISMEKYQ